MLDTKLKTPKRPQRRKLTVWISLEAYVAITDLQRQHLLTTGERQTIQEIVESAILAYDAEQRRKANSYDQS